jgi:hypothetical protein
LAAEGTESANCSVNAHYGITSAVALCGSYGKNLAAGALGIVAIASQIKSAKNCNKALSTDCTLNPTAVGCNVAINCADPANATKPNCICMNNPRTPGCSGVAGSTSDAGVNVSATATTATKGSSDPGFMGGGENGSSAMAGAAAGGAGASGGGAGGGGMGAGGGGGSGKAGDANPKGGGKSLNANILSGDYGSGGGGRAGGSAGGGMNSGSSMDPATLAKYKDYLPGGTKDSARVPASDPVANQVTGGGGKSNWQKVSERYLDNRGRMLGGN